MGRLRCYVRDIRWCGWCLVPRSDGLDLDLIASGDWFKLYLGQVGALGRWGAFLLEALHEVCAWLFLHGEVAQGDTGDEEKGSEHGRGAGQEVARASGTEHRAGCAAAKGGTCIGTLAMLHQHQTNETNGQKEMENSQYGLHEG